MWYNSCFGIFSGILFDSVLTDSQIYQQLLNEDEQEYRRAGLSKFQCYGYGTEDGLKIPKVIEKVLHYLSAMSRML